MIYRLSLASPKLQQREKAKCSTAAVPKLFTFRERSRKFRDIGMQVSLVTMSRPSPELLLHLLVYHWI
jgi:hypothetical protein